MNKLSEGSELTLKVFSDFMMLEFAVDEKNSKLMYEELFKESKSNRL